MKKIYLLMASLLTLVSCEKEVKFNGEQLESKLVLYCNATPGEKLVADVSVSVFFLDRLNGNADFTDPLDKDRGSVKVYVNGSDTPYEMTYSPREPRYYYYDPDNPENQKPYPPETLCYSCDYVPQEGDHIKVVASFPGFDEVSGETTVPENHLKLLDCSLRKLEDNTYRYEFTACVDDPGTGPLFYAVHPYVKCCERTNDFVDGGYLENEYEYRWDFSSSDVLFANATEQLIAFVEGEDGVSHYFSNDLVYGKRHEFKFSLDITSWYIDGQYETYSYDGKDYFYETTYDWYLSLQTLDEGFYYHKTSRDQLNSDFGLFSEGVTLYSNVKGGYGTVCSSVTNSVHLPVK